MSSNPLLREFPHCKAIITFYENKKSACLFSKMFFRTFIRLFHKLLVCVLCLFFSSIPSAEELCEIPLNQSNHGASGCEEQATPLRVKNPPICNPNDGSIVLLPD